jgi:hypothetical protein
LDADGDEGGESLSTRLRPALKSGKVFGKLTDQGKERLIWNTGRNDQNQRAHGKDASDCLLTFAGNFVPMKTSWAWYLSQGGQSQDLKSWCIRIPNVPRSCFYVSDMDVHVGNPIPQLGHFFVVFCESIWMGIGE